MKNELYVGHMTKHHVSKTIEENEQESKFVLAKIKQEMEELKGLMEELTAIKKKGQNVP